MTAWRLMLACLLLALPSIGWGAAGDVAFRIPDRVWHVDPGGLSLTLDVFVDVDSQASVTAIGWGMVVNITPQLGATGSVQFAPPAIVGNLPNLSPASTNPYLDFDRDEDGMSYGDTTISTELNAFSAYVEPVLETPPTVDANGNLTLPDGSGLVALPISISADASGSFLVSFNSNPAVTGIVYATGLAEPNDIAVHPVGAHVAGLLSIVNLPGDYNLDGMVNAADYTIWRNSLGQTGLAVFADGSGNGVADQADYSAWKNHFGATAGSGSFTTASVPEPASAWLFVIAAGAVVGYFKTVSERTKWRGEFTPRSLSPET